MHRERNVPGKTMRDLALTILGRNAEKQIEAALRCTPAQAHRIVQHDRCPGPLRQALIDFLEKALELSQRRLEVAEDDLKRIRYARMVGRAEARRLEADHQARLAAARRGGPEQPSLNLGMGSR